MRFIALVVIVMLAGCRTSRAPQRPAEERFVMDRVEAQHVLVRSRDARWDFPTSSGRPVAPNAPAWADELARDRQMFVDAAKALVSEGRIDDATELAANVWRIWVYARDDAGGRAFLAMVLERPTMEPSRALSLALYGDGLFAFRTQDLEASRVRNEAALSMARAIHDAEAEGLALLGLSRVELSTGNHAKARELAAASRATLRALGASFGQAPLHMLAQATRFTGPVDEAAALFAESLQLNRTIGDRGMVLVELHNLGHVELRRGNVEVAEKCFAESAAAASADDPYDNALVRMNQAAVAFARGDRARAAALLDEVRSLLSAANITLATDDQYEFDRLARELAQ